MNQRQAAKFANEVYKAVNEDTMSYAEAEVFLRSLQRYLSDSQLRTAYDFFRYNRLNGANKQVHEIMATSHS